MPLCLERHSVDTFLCRRSVAPLLLTIYRERGLEAEDFPSADFAFGLVASLLLYEPTGEEKHYRAPDLF